VRLNTGVLAKTDAMQRGRIAMDTVTQQLRSQVCLDYQTSAVVANSTASSVTFYADYTMEGVKPLKRTITLDPVKHEIRSARFDSPSTLVPPPAGTYSTTATATGVLLENAWAQTDAVGNSVPFLRYYAYRTQDGNLRADEELTSPLDAAEAARVARIDIAFFARPTRATDDKRGVNLSDQVMARHADPNKTIPDPNCI
jgi:hypothetical protein